MQNVFRVKTPRNRRQRVRDGRLAIRETFPGRVVVPLHIEYEVTVTSTTGAFASLTQFQLNDVYDPTGSGGTRRPRYYSSIFGADDGTAPYGHFHVLRAHVRLTGASNDAKVYSVGMEAWNDEGSTADSMAEVRERAPWGQVVMVPAQSGIVKLSQSYDLAKLSGRTMADYLAEDTYGADAGASPSKVLGWKFHVQAAAAQTVTFTGLVEVDFEVEASQLVDVADS